MANDEHVAMLARGGAAWNEWRADRDETPDLSRAGLRGLDLSGFDLSRADLRGADLRGTNLSGSNLSDAHPGRCQLLQGGARWRRSCRGFFERSPILELRSARWRPELAISLPR